MIRKHSFLGYLLILFAFAQPLCGQIKRSNGVQDLLGFDELKEIIAGQQEDSLKLKIVQASLDKARYRLDTLRMADAYYFLSKLSHTDQLRYADSLITITQSKKYEKYPAFGYLRKGNIRYEEGNYKEALELYLLASKFAKQNGNEHLYYTLKFNIGLLKNTAGERNEAQTFFIDYLNFVDNNPEFINDKAYNRVLFALADNSIYSKKLDQAKSYIDKGANNALETNDMAIYSSFVSYYGIYYYFSEDYRRAIDSLNRGKELIQKLDQVKTRIAICDYYIACSYMDLGETEASIDFFKKVDSVLVKSEDVIPELMDTYDYLIAYYKSKGETQKQIDFINTLLRLDSIRHTNELYLIKNIGDRYDKVELIEKKEQLIGQLEQEKLFKENTIIILIFFLGIIGLLAGYGFRRNYLNRKRFEALLEKQKKKTDAPEFVAEIVGINNKMGVDISEDVVENVLKKLHVFENSDKFSKKQYTLNMLAKELNTNSAYLSKIINVYKNINFANYLNNLRVDYAVDRLTVDKSLRSYTIKAIAEEVGFKNAQSFSSAFHKKTGIYPSYFIKQLNN